MGEAMALADSIGAISEGWTGFGVLYTAASRVGGMEIGFVPGEGGKDTAAMLAAGALDAVYLLGADEVDVPDGAFVIYQGHHGDRGAHRADVILPSAAWAEQSGIYVNLEGRPQLAQRAASAPGEAKEDWAILRALSERMGEPLPFDTIEQVRKALFEAVPHLATLGAIEPAVWRAEQGGSVGDTPFAPVIRDFYFTNAICRASEVMAECSKLHEERSGVKLAAE
jgi:NADH-quinone oxidoreductase subunit G